MESWLLGHFEIVNRPYPNATWFKDVVKAPVIRSILHLVYYMVLLICSVLFGFSSRNRTLINLFGLGRTVKHNFGQSLVCLSCTSYTSRFHQVASKSNAQRGQI